MKKHFYDYAKVSSIIDRVKPSIVMELGCGEYENTLCLLSYLYKEGSDYALVSITDNALPIYLPPYLSDRFLLINGISYGILAKYEEVLRGAKDSFKKKIDLVILDSDHNYFTVSQELKTLLPHLSEKSVLVFHDTNNYEEAGLKGLSFTNIHPETNSTYQARGYADGTEYPKEEILKTFHLSIVDAINEFVAQHPEFSITYKTTESCGVYVVERGAK